MKCLVPSCKNRSDCQNWKTREPRSSNVKLTFHSLPKNLEICASWLKLLDVKVPAISKHARICSDHFEEKYFDRTGSNVRLRPNALPRQILVAEKSCGNTIRDDASTNSSIDTSILLRKVQSSCSNAIQDETNANSSLDTTQPLTSEMKSEIKKDTITLYSTSQLFDKCPLSPEHSASTSDKGTIVTAELIYNSPEKCRLRNRIKYLEAETRKKIKLLQQQLRRKNNKILALESILNDLRSA